MDLQTEITNLKPWFHNIHLPGGTTTAPGHSLGDFPAFKWEQIRQHVPEDLTGWSVLDIGCNAGFYSVELAKRGARVLGIDVDPHYLRQAAWVAKQLGLEDRIELQQMQVYDLAHLDRQFDLVWFMGVFYHLRYPLLALDIVTQRVEKMLVFQTLTMPGESVLAPLEDIPFHGREIMQEEGYPKMAFIEHKLAGDLTNWWAPNHAGIEAMLRSCGMRVVQRPGHEVYVCEPDAALPSAIRSWNRSEFLSATGRPWLKEVHKKVKDKNKALSK
jgi:tRNA (mo5U34)-methyltransferase